MNGDQITTIHGITGETGQVILMLPVGDYRFKTNTHNLSYYSAETNTCTVPTCTEAAISVPVFGQVTVSVANTANAAQPNLPVVAYRVVEITSTATPEPTPTAEPTQEPTEEPEENLANQTELVETGISGTTDAEGHVTFDLPEGTYRFKAEQYSLPFWSNTANHCSVPTCTTASVTVLGSGYSANDQTITYTYDDLNRLTAADYDNGLYYHYAYDAIGNRTTQESSFDEIVTNNVYTYDDANRIASVNDQPYTFDANGNLLSDGEYTYTYDSANRLVGSKQRRDSHILQLQWYW